MNRSSPMGDRHSELSMARDMPPLECRSPEVVELEVLVDLNACAPRAHHPLDTCTAAGWEVQGGAGAGGAKQGRPGQKAAIIGGNRTAFVRVFGGMPGHIVWVEQISERSLEPQKTPFFSFSVGFFATGFLSGTVQTKSTAKTP